MLNFVVFCTEAGNKLMTLSPSSRKRLNKKLCSHIEFEQFFTCFSITVPRLFYFKWLRYFNISENIEAFGHQNNPALHTSIG